MKPRQTFSESDLLSAGADICYIYVLYASNDPIRRPRYVGFTREPKNRERAHNIKKKNSGRRGAWIQELKDSGCRAKLEVVHTFRSNDLTECGIVEATWIELYRNKFPDLLNDLGGGLGISKASESVRKKLSAISKKQFSDPAKREEMSQKIKKVYADPKHREKMSRILKLRYQDPEVRAKTKNAAKKRWENPETRAKLSLGRKRTWEDEAYRAKRVSATKKLWENPEYRKKMAESRAKQR